MDALFTALCGAVPELAATQSAERIADGYSTSIKYRITFHGGHQGMLRLSGGDTLARQRSVCELLKTRRVAGMLVPEPLAVGQFQEHAYRLLSYVAGEPASVALKGLSTDRQYEIGVSAGQELRLMHRVLPPPSVPPWGDRMLAKYARWLGAYREGSVRVSHDEDIADFIAANAHAVRHRPNHLQHGDFHTGNLVVRDGQYGGTIDFDSYDWGDPYHEFLKAGYFSRHAGVAFCRGQVVGYFGEHGVPDQFWRLYAVYTAMTVFGSMVWAGRRAPAHAE